MKSMKEIAMELSEFWINGSISHVADEIEAMDAGQAAIVALHMSVELSTDDLVRLANVLEGRL